jgi:hypothetical protein
VTTRPARRARMSGRNDWVTASSQDVDLELPAYLGDRSRLDGSEGGYTSGVDDDVGAAPSRRDVHSVLGGSDGVRVSHVKRQRRDARICVGQGSQLAFAARSRVHVMFGSCELSGCGLADTTAGAGDDDGRHALVVDGLSDRAGELFGSSP